MKAVPKVINIPINTVIIKVTIVEIATNMPINTLMAVATNVIGTSTRRLIILLPPPQRNGKNWL